jgi:hypothetical protein
MTNKESLQDVIDKYGDDMVYLVTKSEHYFYKNSELLTILKNSYQDSEDVQNKDITIMRSFAQSLFKESLDYSGTLSKF